MPTKSTASTIQLTIKYNPEHPKPLTNLYFFRLHHNNGTYIDVDIALSIHDIPRKAFILIDQHLRSLFYRAQHINY